MFTSKVRITNQLTMHVFALLEGVRVQGENPCGTWRTCKLDTERLSGGFRIGIFLLWGNSAHYRATLFMLTYPRRQGGSPNCCQGSTRGTVADGEFDWVSTPEKLWCRFAMVSSWRTQISHGAVDKILFGYWFLHICFSYISILSVTCEAVWNAFDYFLKCLNFFSWMSLSPICNLSKRLWKDVFLSWIWPFWELEAWVWWLSLPLDIKN